MYTFSPFSPHHHIRRRQTASLLSSLVDRRAGLLPATDRRAALGLSATASARGSGAAGTPVPLPSPAPACSAPSLPPPWLRPSPALATALASAAGHGVHARFTRRRHAGPPPFPRAGPPDPSFPSDGWPYAALAPTLAAGHGTVARLRRRNPASTPPSLARLLRPSFELPCFGRFFGRPDDVARAQAQWNERIGRSIERLWSTTGSALKYQIPREHSIRRRNNRERGLGFFIQEARMSRRSRVPSVPRIEAGVDQWILDDSDTSLHLFYPLLRVRVVKYASV